jgi:hypothetical protein
MSEENLSYLDELEQNLEAGSWSSFQENHVPSALVRELGSLTEEYDSVHVGLDLPVFLSIFSKQKWFTDTSLDNELETVFEDLMGPDFAFHYSKKDGQVFYENEVTYGDTIDVLRELETSPDVEMYHTDQLSGALKGMEKAIKDDIDYSEVDSLRNLRQELNQAQLTTMKAANQISTPVKVTEKISGNNYQKGHLDREYTDITEDDIWARALQREVEKNNSNDETPLTVMMTYDGGFTEESDQLDVEGDYMLALPPELIKYV